MDEGIQGRVEALRREIAEIQRLNLAHLQRLRWSAETMNDHERRDQGLREIMHELESMTDWKKS
jgi:hypothetical protein